MQDGYIPQNERKKILLLSDDLRMPSGVGVMSREIVLGTAHRYNWVQLAAATHHPEQGKCYDASQSVNEETGLTDSFLRIYPYTGYGDPPMVRRLIEIEKPDAILHFTDPRYWIWLYQMEHELRQQLPLLFYHVWDDLPYPKYNRDYYRSCDFIASISKQTHNIVKQVWNKHPLPQPWQLKYIPHGINETKFYKVTSPEDLSAVAELKARLFNGVTPKFVVMYNNRNIRRKMTGDVILAYREFLLGLPEAERDDVRLLLHTQPVDDNGTDLPRVIMDVAPEIKVTFSAERVDTRTMNFIYNCADVVINLASNEGFGLGTAEALMAERLIVANVTGGLQDQMGFIDERGQYLDPDTHFSAEWGSNADGKYDYCGPWAYPCFPVQRALIGSPL